MLQHLAGLLEELSQIRVVQREALIFVAVCLVVASINLHVREARRKREMFRSASFTLITGVRILKKDLVGDTFERRIHLTGFQSLRLQIAQNSHTVRQRISKQLGSYF